MPDLQDQNLLLASLVSRALGGQAAGLLMPRRSLGAAMDGIAGISGAFGVAVSFEAARINLPALMGNGTLALILSDLWYGFFGGGIAMIVVGVLGRRNAP